MKARLTVLRVLLFAVVLSAVLFGTAGTFGWWNGWAYLGMNLTAGAAVVFGIFRRWPDLDRERRTAAGKAPPQDRILANLITLLPFLAMVLAGLDKRWGWTAPFGTGWNLAGLAVGAAAATLVYRAMWVNRFFSSHARIQKDRKHRVIDRGPYAVVRHPGYTGMILVNLSAPVLLNSFPSLAVGVLTAGVIVLRTVLEDRMLQRGLPGYRDYARRVRSRLVPVLW